MSVSISNREFNKHLSASLNSMIKVILDYDYPNRFYLGRLVGFEVSSQTICLTEARDEKSNKYDKIFVRGPTWATFSLEGEPFPMDRLVERLRKILPGESIELGHDNTIVLLGGKLKVTEKGVEGRGPTRERVQKVFDAFCAELR